MKNLVQVQNNQVIVSSRQIAEHFEKEHRNVIRDIEGLLKIEQATQELFFKTTYIHEQNHQEYPEYLISKKGFQVLAMGFTGQKALKWKLKYIEAFEKMEEELKNPKVTTTTKPHYRQRMISTAVKDAANTAKSLMKLFAVKEGIAQATAFKMIENAYAIDLSPVKQLIQPAKHITGFLTPTALGMQLGGKKGAEINKKLMDLGLQVQEIDAKGKKIWRLTATGKTYGEEFPYDAKSGHSGYQIKWNENVLSLINMGEGAAL